MLKQIARNKTLAEWTQSALEFYQAKGLQKTIRHLKLPRHLGLAEIDRLLPKPSVQWPMIEQTAMPAGGEKGTVGLFTGCMGSLLDRETVNAAVRCLTAAGYRVYVPGQQTCCGAIDRHDGDLATAGRLSMLICRR